MAHDPLCYYREDEWLAVQDCAECTMIAHVRADERNEIKISLQMIERLIGGAQIRLAINTINKRGKDENSHDIGSGN